MSKKDENNKDPYQTQKEEIGKRIAQLRTEKNMSQEELAKELNYAQNTISKIETGYNALTLENLIRLTKFFNVSYDYICDGKNLTILDILTQYIKIDYATTKDFQSTYPVLKINSALINYLFMVDTAKSLFPATDNQKSLLNEQEDIFYKQIKENDGTLNELSIPLTKEVIFPDEYQKEWEKIINLKNALPNKHSQIK